MRRSGHRGWKDQLRGRGTSYIVFQYETGRGVYTAYLRPMDPSPADETIQITRQGAVHHTKTSEVEIKNMLRGLCKSFAKSNYDLRLGDRDISFDYSPRSKTWIAKAYIERSHI